MKDLTKGNVAKNLIMFSLPMLLGNILQQLYNTIDGIILGHYNGVEAQAAIGASFPVFFLLIALIFGVTMGSTILISQYYGAKNMEKVKETIDTAYIFLFFSVLIITIVGIIFSEPLLRLLQVPENVLPEAKTYLNIMFGGVIFLFGYNSISAILRGLGDSKTPLLFLVISTVINIVLDIYFIANLGWGAAGAAAATVIAQGISFAFGIYHLNKTHEVFKLNIKNMKFNKPIFRMTLKLGLPTGIQQTAFAFGMMCLQGIVNGFGEETMAAYFAGGRVDTFASMPIMSLSAAVSTFAGQNIGAGKEDRVKEGLKVSIIIAAIMSLATTIILTGFKTQLIWIFNNNSEVIKIGSRYLTIVAPFYIVVGSYMMAIGLLRGIGDTYVPMIISLTSLWFVRYPIAKLLSPSIGSDGIWWGMPIGWCVGFILTFGYYASGRWKKKVAIKKTKTKAKTEAMA